MVDKNKVLVLSTEQTLRDLLKLVLTDALFNVETTNSAEKAFDLIKNGEFDLLLTDYQVGESAGTDIINDLKILEPELKTVLMSGGAPIISNADGFIRKPFESLDMLIATVDKILAEN